MRVHLDLFAEGVRQPREPAHAHQHREVLTFHPSSDLRGGHAGAMHSPRGRFLSAALHTMPVMVPRAAPAA